jgi:restriction system protein
MKGSAVMARRKSKAKQEDEMINGLIGLVIFGTFIGTYYFTKSLSTSIGVTIVAFAVVIAALIIRKMNYMDKLRRSGINDIDKMEGREFELYLGELFKKHGYEVNVTKLAGDYGADLVIVKGGKKIVVQAKRYSKNVGIKAVQEAQASIAHYGASEAWVVSNSDYTTAAYELAKSNRVRLIHRDELIEMMLQTKQVTPKLQLVKEAPKALQTGQVQNNVDPIVEDVTCSRCGSNMVRRSNARGEFLGCGNFPKCRNTITLNSRNNA